MTEADFIELKNFDSEDIGDVLVKIERSFDFKFGRNELSEIKTFGDFCDIIVNKLQFVNVQDCTSQQAFYKLRNAICNTQGLTNEEINTGSELKTIFPRASRRRKVKQLESFLGFSLNILSPPNWLLATIIFIFLVSVIGLFFKWQEGLIGIAFCIICFNLSNRLGKEINLKTVGQLADKMANEHYLKSRRNVKTVNSQEVVEKTRNLFAIGLDLSQSALTRDATFI